MPQVVYLTVGHTQRLLGQAFEAGDVPELLRYVADYYDDNPDDCAQLFHGRRGSSPGAPAYLSAPFGAA